MGKKHAVRWTEKASITYIDTISFILKNWSLKEVEHFEILVKDLLKHLSANSTLCPKSKVINVRKCIVSSQTSLIYRLKPKSIELLAFIDNRSDHSY